MPDTVKRWKMRHILAEHPVAERWLVRPVTLEDGPLLGALMYDAYHDTIDDEGETPASAVAEIEGTLNGKYGPLLGACSFVIEEDGRALGATVITDWSDERTGERQPLLTFLMVRPEASGQGMGTYLLSRSVNALLAHSERELVLFVTVGNSAAQRVYQKLGFDVEEEFESNRPASE
jgi:ribosomal protein S18 acetylase RimI-like enzyme